MWSTTVVELKCTRPALTNSVLVHLRRTSTNRFCSSSFKLRYTIELFSHCKGGNFNIHIRAWFGYSICSRSEVLITCLSCPNMRAFHENLYRLYTELTFINPLSANTTRVVCFFRLKQLRQTVETQIRRLPWEPSDLGPHCCLNTYVNQ